MVRLTIFSKYANNIVIGYSNISHQGNPLPPISFVPFRDEISCFGPQLYHFQIDISNMTKFRNSYPGETDVWVREKSARNSLIIPLQNQFRAEPTDIVYLSDTDELPSPDTMNHILNGAALQNPAHVNCHMLYYGIRWLHELNWCAPYFAYYNDVQNRRLDDLRLYVRQGQIGFHGIHISYAFPRIEDYIHKITNFVHSEYNKPPFTTPEFVFAVICCGHDIYGRGPMPYDLGTQFYHYLPSPDDPRFFFFKEPFPNSSEVLELNWTLLLQNFSFCPRLKYEFEARKKKRLSILTNP